MGFFLETLLGGLMAGMLYSLVALGFVLIFKASGVFNFAQGAMVLFAALAMARFSEWLNAAGIGQAWMVNLLAFGLATLVMFAVARAQRLSDFLEIMSDERQGLSAKIRGLRRVFWRSNFDRSRDPDDATGSSR